MMAIPTSRILAAALALMVSSVCAIAQGVSCGSGSGAVTGPLPQIAPMAAPTGATVRVWVDPIAGNDQVASTAGGAFKTIQAASDAMAGFLASSAGTGNRGMIELMPGRYGWKPGDTRYNGEVWPVAIRSGVSIQGLDALQVIIDGSAKMSSAQTVILPAGRAGAPNQLTPCFVAEENGSSTFDHTIIDRLTIVKADVGILIRGSGEVDLTIAESCFASCNVGVQIHSNGLTQEEGIHSPRILWCTFGNCDTGLIESASIAGVPTAPRARPSVINGLFKNTADFEGLSCMALSECAFAPARVNTSGMLSQPQEFVATPAFDTDTYTLADLFIGASHVNQSLPVEQQFFTDWRLTFRTSIIPTEVNPASLRGITAFPTSTPNGTGCEVVFGDFMIGVESAEGAGTYGPLGDPFGGSTGHLGYRSGGTFVVGGTVPMERRFGLADSGLMFDVMDIRWKPTAAAVALACVFPAHPLWRSGQLHAMGVLSSGLPLNINGANFLGQSFLDLHSYAPTNLTPLLSTPGTNSRMMVNLNLPFASSWTLACAWQAILQEGSNFVASDVQTFSSDF